jgi:hypothetical protein
MEVEVKVKVKFNLEPATKTQSSIGTALFLISARDRNVWSVPCPGRFTPEKDPVPIVQEAGRAPFSYGRERKTSPPPQFDRRTVQPVATRYTDYAISAHGRRGCYCMMFRRR